jgi:hypothetical protein
MALSVDVYHGYAAIWLQGGKEGVPLQCRGLEWGKDVLFFCSFPSCYRS